MVNFTEAFNSTKTSKANHGYGVFYQKMLIGEDVDSLLEIGVYLGQSLYSWRLVYPSAIIEAVDRDMRFENKVAQDFTIFNFDSRSKVEVDRYIDRDYDIVIDDGNHHWAAQIETYRNFSRYAKKFYVIEDVCGDYSFKKLMENFDDEVKSRMTTFVGTGPPRTFRHGDHFEHDAEYKIIFIDQRKDK